MSGDAAGPGSTPAGWYDDPAGPGQRWWDGAAWTEHRQAAAPPPQPLAYQPAPAACPRNPQATAGLVLGIVALVVNTLAVVSVLAGVLSVLGLTKANRLQAFGYAPVGRTKAVWGLVLAVVAFFFTAQVKFFLF